MTRHAFIPSITALWCLTAIVIGSPTWAFTTSCHRPMKQRSVATSVQQLAHQNRHEPSMDDLSRRRTQRSTSLIPQYMAAAVMAVLTIAMSFPILPSNAGLLDEYGAGLTVNPPTTKSEPATTSSSKPSNGGNVQIDPTLRGCKFDFFSRSIDFLGCNESNLYTSH
jgi:hypothetical protein